MKTTDAQVREQAYWRKKSTCEPHDTVHFPSLFALSGLSGQAFFQSGRLSPLNNPRDRTKSHFSVLLFTMLLAMKVHLFVFKTNFLSP
jgi:hypothetical protein